MGEGSGPLIQMYPHSVRRTSSAWNLNLSSALFISFNEKPNYAKKSSESIHYNNMLRLTNPRGRSPFSYLEALHQAGQIRTSQSFVLLINSEEVCVAVLCRVKFHSFFLNSWASNAYLWNFFSTQKNVVAKTLDKIKAG